MPDLIRHPPSSFFGRRTGGPRIKSGVTGQELERPRRDAGPFFGSREAAKARRGRASCRLCVFAANLPRVTESETAPPKSDTVRLRAGYVAGAGSPVDRGSRRGGDE